MRLTRFGTVDLPEANAQDTFPISARSGLVDLPNGAFDRDGQRLFLRPARITRRTEMNGAEIDPRINALFKELGKGRNILRAMWRDDVTEMVTWGKLVNVQRSVDVDTYDCKTPLVITWEQDYPYWIHSDDGWFFDSGETFDSGLNFDGAYRHFIINTALPYDFTILNEGNVALQAMTWVIVPRTPGSSLVNPKISNLTNGMSFQYTGTVAAGERLVVDILTRTAELDGTSVYENFSLSGDKQVQWMLLETDTNSMRLTGTLTGAMDMYVIMSRHYL